MALLDELLTERSRRYRRNLMAISFITIAVWWADNIDFSNAKLFGIGFKAEQPCGKPDDVELTFWWFMLLLFVYQSTMLAQSARTDFLIWFRASRRTISEFQSEENRNALAPPRTPTAETERDVRMRQFKYWDMLIPGVAGLIAITIIVHRLWQLA